VRSGSPCICILAALKREVWGLLDRLESPARRRSGGLTVYSGEYGGRPVRVIRTGMGHHEIDSRLLRSCGLLVSTGYCGGCAPGLSPGDVVIAREVAFLAKSQVPLIMRANAADNPRKRFSLLQVRGWRDIEDLFREGAFPVHVGRTVTVEKVLATPREKRAVHGYFGAVSVDMEDFFRLREAGSAGIPGISLRAVLDGAEDTLPGAGSVFPSRIAALKRAADRASEALKDALALLLHAYPLGESPSR
jgi:nucleoside phosphorylase